MTAALRADRTGLDTRLPRYTSEASALVSLIEGFASAYNYDHSDSQSDYYSVNFYDGRLGFSYEIERAERETIASAK